MNTGDGFNFKEDLIFMIAFNLAGTRLETLAVRGGKLRVIRFADFVGSDGSQRSVKVRRNATVTPCGRYLLFKSKFLQRGTRSALIVSDNMTGKMLFMPALSTSCLLNEFCAARMNNAAKLQGTVCPHCFAGRGSLKTFPGLASNAAYNTYVLNGGIIPEAYLPRFDPAKIKTGAVRLESFGDCQSSNYVINMSNICRVNPGLRFAIWSKNVGFYRRAWGRPEDGLKPNNLNYVASSLFLNRPLTVDPGRDWFVDRVFTVYTAEYAATNGVNINCCEAGKPRRCADCLNCYRPGGPFRINETLRPAAGIE